MCNKERDSLLWRVGRVSVYGGLVGESCGNDTFQLKVSRLTLIHQKWLLRERGTRSDGRGQKERSFPLGLLWHWTQPHNHPSLSNDMLRFLPCSGRRETRKNIFCWAFKKNRLHCAQSTDTLIASRRWACQSVLISISLRALTFPVWWTLLLVSCLQLLFYICRSLLLSGQFASHIINYLLSG